MCVSVDVQGKGAEDEPLQMDKVEEMNAQQDGCEWETGHMAKTGEDSLSASLSWSLHLQIHLLVCLCL